MPFTIVQCPIAGLYEIQPKVFTDNRGYFFESWSQRDFEAAGINYDFVQDNDPKVCCAGCIFKKSIRKEN